MSFDVAAEAYDRFMGRYSSQLSSQLADFAGLERGQRVLDVGCGPGALTTEIVARLGPAAVTAVDPSEIFVRAAIARLPDVDVRVASAGELPFRDGTFDAVLAQLVLHLMADPSRGLRDMVRVTKPGGTIAACVWDFSGESTGPLGPFWRAARELDPNAPTESGLAGAHEGDLADMFERAGLRDVTSGVITARVEHPTFDAWWEPFTLGVGPSGQYAAGLDARARDRLKERCHELLPQPPFVVTADAWVARGAKRNEGDG